MIVDLNSMNVRGENGWVWCCGTHSQKGRTPKGNLRTSSNPPPDACEPVMSVMMSVPPPLMFVLVGGMFVCCKDGGHCSNISSSEAGETPPTSLKLPPWHGESFVPARILQPQHHGWWVGVVCWCGGVGVVVWCGGLVWCTPQGKETHWCICSCGGEGMPDKPPNMPDSG